MSLFDIQLNYLNSFGTERYKNLISLYHKECDKRNITTRVSGSNKQLFLQELTINNLIYLLYL